MHKRTCEKLHEEISKYVTAESGGDQLAKLEEMKFRVPRGSFELQLFSKVSASPRAVPRGPRAPSALFGRRAAAVARAL